MTGDEGRGEVLEMLNSTGWTMYVYPLIMAERGRLVNSLIKNGEDKDRYGIKEIDKLLNIIVPR